MTANGVLERLSMPPNVEYRHIKWRADGNPTGNGSVRVVPYLEAWACAHYLDLWIGPANWRDSYEPTGKDGVMWCHIDVRDLIGEWVRHSDVGTASTYEAAKGLVSDAFKRCAQRKWGIGRNIYELPGPLWIPSGTYRTYKSSKGHDVVQLNERSQAEILRQLHARGVDVSERDVAVGPGDDEDHDDSPPPAPQAQRPVQDVVSPVLNGDPARDAQQVHPGTASQGATPADPGPDAYPGNDLDRKGTNREHKDLIADIERRASDLVKRKLISSEQQHNARGYARKSVEGAQQWLRYFASLEPNTTDVGHGNESSNSGAENLDEPDRFHRWEMANLSNAGVDEQMRHDLARVVSIGRANATSELSQEERRQRVQIAQRVKAGKVKAAYGAEGALTLVDPSTGERVDPWKLP